MPPVDAFDMAAIVGETLSKEISVTHQHEDVCEALLTTACSELTVVGPSNVTLLPGKPVRSCQA